MGGKCLKKVICSRINLEDYNNIKKDLEIKFSKYLEIKFTIEVPGKIDFGDIDILYKYKLDEVNIIHLIQLIYEPIEIVKNGPVCSFSYYFEETNKYFQVDLILVEDLEMSNFYFSYGDLGGIIGRITKNYCLTFGSTGLWANINEETKSKCINKYQLNFSVEHDSIIKSYIPFQMLTSDPKKICEYLGLNWEIWSNGFNSKEEIFEWICQSPWFEPNSFRVLLNHEHRHRANSRPMYQEFINYIYKDEDNLIIEKANIPNNINLNKNLQLESLEYFDKINNLINEFLPVEKKIIRKEKFNGKKLLDLGIESKQLNKYLDSFNIYIKSKFNLEFNDWLDLNNSEEINNVLKTFIDNK